jgi:hypothetical protein
MGPLLRRIGRRPDARAGESGAFPGEEEEQQEWQTTHERSSFGAG